MPSSLNSGALKSGAESTARAWSPKGQRRLTAFLAIRQKSSFAGHSQRTRDNDNMRSARRRPEHGKASLKTIGNADLGTRKRHADALVGWHTDVVDDDPQPTPVGGRGRMRQIRDSGEDQPHGRRETSDFAQDEPFRNAAHCRIKAGPVSVVKEYT